jgi:hypothetical protein
LVAARSKIVRADQNSAFNRVDCDHAVQVTKMGFIAFARDALTIIGLLAAGYFFLLRREFYPRAQFDLLMRLLGERENELLLELAATIKNIGMVRHSIRRFSYSLRGLDVASPWIKNADLIDLIDFPRKLQNGVWVREKFTTVIEPGTDQRFYFIVKVSPANVEYFNLYSVTVLSG